jgi:hypothetical protein
MLDLGRPAINGVAMTAAERQRRRRAKLRDAERITKPSAGLCDADRVTKLEARVAELELLLDEVAVIGPGRALNPALRAKVAALQDGGCDAVHR